MNSQCCFGGNIQNHDLLVLMKTAVDAPCEIYYLYSLADEGPVEVNLGIALGNSGNIKGSFSGDSEDALPSLTSSEWTYRDFYPGSTQCVPTQKLFNLLSDACELSSNKNGWLYGEQVSSEDLESLF